MGESEPTKEELAEKVRRLHSELEELRRRDREHTEARRKLLQAAKEDPRTGVFERVEFMERLKLAVRSSKRYKYPLSLCVCELDSRDAASAPGTGNGSDGIVAQLGRIIREQIRCHDAAGRLEGNAFCIVFPHTTASDATSATGRIRGCLEGLQWKLPDGETRPVTASFGIARFAPAHETEEDLLEAARGALQRAIESGGNCLVVKAA
ncbi:MAG: GGDEF domain-containing protein [Candidatus Brocadiia bacterium]